MLDFNWLFGFLSHLWGLRGKRTMWTSGSFESAWWTSSEC